MLAQSPLSSLYGPVGNIWGDIKQLLKKLATLSSGGAIWRCEVGKPKNCNSLVMNKIIHLGDDCLFMQLNIKFLRKY